MKALCRVVQTGRMGNTFCGRSEEADALERHQKLSEKAAFTDREGKVRTLPEPGKTSG